MESHDNEPAPPPRLRRGKLVKGVLKSSHSAWVGGAWSGWLKRGVPLHWWLPVWSCCHSPEPT